MKTIMASIVPNPDYQEKHAIQISAKPEIAWRTLQKMDIYDSKLIRLLFSLRGLKFTKRVRLEHATWSESWNRLFQSGFKPISIVENKSIIMKLDNKLLARKSKQISIVWDFVLIPHIHGTILSTETRVSFLYKRHRNLFLPYWLIIRIPSAVIRREMLRLVRHGCKVLLKDQSYPC